MRKHLLETFDEIYVLDLHGNAKKKESAPDGSKDENVFDIQQGVAISIMIRKCEQKEKPGIVKFAELYGKRNKKFVTLNENELNTISWEELKIDIPNYFFTKKDFNEKTEYDKEIKLEELFISYSSGIKTHRDSFVMDFEKREIENRINDFINFSKTDNELQRTYNLKNTTTFQITNARKQVAKENLEDHLKIITYRPFDERYIYYSSNVIDRDRKEIMTNMFQHNIAILTKRGVDVKGLVSITKNIFEIRVFSNPGSQGSDFGFPLYVYSKDGTKIPNLKAEIVEQIEKIVGQTKPEEILDYIYAILHSPKYRKKYKEFLKIDFPRVPCPKDKKTFKKLIKFGTELRLLHLLESPKVNKFITTFPKLGSDIIDKINYKNGNVIINDEQYFGKVPEIAWNFYIGGYQPAQKWLKDRKGKKLTNEDIEHYQKIIVALVETDRIMKEIDGDILEF